MLWKEGEDKGGEGIEFLYFSGLTAILGEDGGGKGCVSGAIGPVRCGGRWS